MTSIQDRTGIDSDLVDDGRRPWRAAIGAAVVGVVVGGLLGALAGSLGTQTYQATTSLSVLPDPTLSTTTSSSANVVSQDATTFIQSELVVINGNQLAGQVGSDLRLGGPAQIVATQLGQSYVVQVTGTADSPGVAARVASTAADDYAGLRSSQLRAQVASLQSAVSRQITSVSTELAAARRGQSATAAETPSQIALQTEYEQLLSARSQLGNTPVAAASVVRVLTPARADKAALSSVAKDALFGALIGALVALLLLLAVRRSFRRVTGLADLAALGAPVLLPTLPAVSAGAIRSGTAWRAPAARLLAGRLRADVVAAGSLLVVAGTDEPSGRGVAPMLAANLVDRRPVLLVSRHVTAASAEAADEVSDGDLSSEKTPDTDDPAAIDTGWFGADLGQIDAYRPEHHAAAATPGLLARPSSVPGLWLLPQPSPAGGPGPDPARRALVDMLHDAVAAGWLVVFDAPALDGSGLAVDCVDDGGALLIVAGRGRTRPADVVAVLDLCDARGMAPAGVVLNAGERRLRLRGARRPALPGFGDGAAVPVAAPPWQAPDAGPARLPQHRPKPSSNGRRPIDAVHPGR